MTASRIIPRVPSYVPHFGHALAFGSDADTLLAHCRDQYGDVFEIKLADKRVTFFMNPRDYPAFIRQSRDLSSEDLSIDIAAAVFGFDKEHLRQHVDIDRVVHMNQRFMQGEELGPLTERMQDKVEAILLDEQHHTIPQGKLFDFALELIFMAGSDALFGEGVASPETMASFKIVDRYFPLRIGKVPALFLPGFSKAVDHLASVMGHARAGQSKLMEERFRYFDTIPAYDRTRELPLTDTSLMWAAQANTAVVAFFTLFFILRDPQLKKMIEQEVRSALATSNKHSARGTPYLTADVLERMEKLDACISETLRLTSSPLPMRQVMKDMEIELVSGGSVQLRQGQYAALYPRYMHLHPEIYANPEQFYWDRFLGKQKPNSFSYQGEPLKYALLPFGVGLSMCPGRHFARNEFKVITALILNWCDIDLQETTLPEFDKGRVGLGSLTPKSDIPFRLQRTHD
jgi:cytochrome P450